jgi:Uma2 family endonuclease
MTETLNSEELNMATVQQHQPITMTEEEYLNCFTFEPDAEFTDGIVEERPVGTIEHGRWQIAIATWFKQHEKEWNIESLPEVRVRLRPGLNKIPDVIILDLANGRARGKIVTSTPIAVFEVFSPDEHMKELRLKFAQYDLANIPHIWFVDPDKGVWQRYVDGVLVPSEEFTHGTISFHMAEITALVLD